MVGSERTPAPAHGAPHGAIGALVVSYFPDDVLLRRQFDALIPQVDHIVIVDNGSPPSAVAALSKLAARGPAVSLLCLPSNLGIASAQNRGVIELRRLGCAMVLLLDQDSVPSLGMVERLSVALTAGRSIDSRLAAVGALMRDRTSGVDGRFVRIRAGGVRQLACPSPDAMVDVDFLIASGSLICMDALDALGEFEESYFIDHVDTEWCLRARTAGWSLAGVCGAVLLHTLGEAQREIWFGRKRMLYVHSPLRDYYATRNAVDLILRKRMRFSWRMALALRVVLTNMAFVALAAPRLPRLRMIWRGLTDGVLGRLGQRHA